MSQQQWFPNTAIRRDDYLPPMIWPRPQPEPLPYDEETYNFLTILFSNNERNWSPESHHEKPAALGSRAYLWTIL